jgi:hypothetical protein
MPNPRVLLAAYTIRIREKRQKTKYEKLDLFGGAYNFLDVCNKFLTEQLNVYEHDKEARQLMALQNLYSDERTIAGIIRSGQHGQACDVMDVEKAAVVYNKTINDADMLPSYFRIEIPVDVEEGLLIVQRPTHGGGIKTSLIRRLKKFFEANYPEYIPDFNSLLPVDVVKSAISKGNISKITFIHFGLPDDIASRFGSGHDEKSGTMELVMKAKRHSWLPLKDKLTSFIDSGKTNVGEFYELKDINFEVNEVKVDVKVGRQNRTVQLGNLSGSPLYEVTQDIKFSADGNPTYQSIHDAAGQLAEELKFGIYAGARQ